MQNVLADLCLESEAATIAAMRLARAYDEAPPATSRRRASAGSPPRCSSTGLCKRAPWHAVECLECFGGNGYVEESGMPRLYREAPLNSIWEGSGNVQCLDVLRAMARARRRSRPSSPRSRGPPAAEPRLDAFIAALRKELSSRRRDDARPARGGWSSGWRWRCRARCWSATATRRSPTPSAPPA